MQAIDEIPVQVPADIAAAYRQASIEERQQLAVRIGTILRQSFAHSTGTYAQLQQSMNQLAAEAAQNGLTPEMLESILNDG
jgi:ABC-type transporter Mla subunit MlaD